jgi:hypothetical protein
MIRNKLSNTPTHPASDTYMKPGTLIPGAVDRKYFYNLVEICEITNPKMIGALEQVLVAGKTRKEACGSFNVTVSYFSIKIRQLQSVSILLQDIFPCASMQGGCPLHTKTGQ